MLKKFIPDMYVTSIYDIPYTKLYDEGKRLILTDLDNTLISYKEKKVTQQLLQWKEMVTNIGFEIIIVSNNSNKNRVKSFAKDMNVQWVFFAKKPLLFGLKKGVRLASKNYSKNEIIEIGDQLLTDVFGSRRFNVYTILVKAIDKKTEKTATRINRFWERRILKKIKKKYPKDYENNLKKYVEEKE